MNLGQSNEITMNKLFIGCLSLLVLSTLSNFAQGAESVGKRKRLLVLQTDVITRNGVNNIAYVSRLLEPPYPGPKDCDIYIEGPITGEFLEIVVEGKIAKLEHIALKWYGKRLRETGILHTYKNLSNVKIILSTYFTESSPNDKIRITDLNGKKYEVVFVEDNTDPEDKSKRPN